MLEIKDLTVKYPDGTQAIKDFSMSIQDGESIALIGANGAGKTTLLLSIVGVLPFTNGSISVDNIVLNKKTINEVRSKIGLVFQNPDDQLFMPDIYDDVAFGPRNLGMSEVETEKLVNEILADLGISHLKERSSIKLSGGEKRMAAIAGVLAMSPTVMLFDEPTAFLDPRARRTLINTLKQLPQTKIIATHDMEFALDVCDKVVLIKNGEFFHQGISQEILFDKELMDACYVEAIERRNY